MANRRGCRAIFALSLLIGLATEARADILMLDLNLSYSEVQAAREAAHERGENLIVIPEIPEPIRKKHAALANQILRQETRIKALKETLKEKEQPEAPLQERIAHLSSEVDTARQEQSKLILPEMQMSDKMLEAALQRIEGQGGRLSNLVISGHSGGSTFWGSAGRVFREGIHSVFEKFPKSRESLRAIHFMGCYSNTPETSLWWKARFPSLKVLVGFSSKAPLSQTTASPAILKDTLLREQRFAKLEEVKPALQAIKTVPHSMQTSLAGTFNSCYVGTQVKSQLLTEVNDACFGVRARLEDGADLFESFRQSFEGGYEDVPADTDHSPLRDYYNLLQLNSHCTSLGIHLPPREQVLGLIFFKNVRRNFARYFAKELQEVSEALKKAGVSEHQRLPDLGAPDLQRRALLARGRHLAQIVYDMDYLERWITQESQSIEKLKAERAKADLGWMDRARDYVHQITGLGGSDAALEIRVREQGLEEKKKERALLVPLLGKLRNMSDRIQMMLIDLKCVPPTWITEEPRPDAAPAAPSC